MQVEDRFSDFESQINIIIMLLILFVFLFFLILGMKINKKNNQIGSKYFRFEEKQFWIMIISMSGQEKPKIKAPDFLCYLIFS